MGEVRVSSNINGGARKVGINCFYRAELGFGSGENGSELRPILPLSIKVPEVSGNIVTIGVGDQSQNQLIFHGRVKTSDADVEVVFPVGPENDWIREKANAEWETRSNMDRWTLIVYQYDENNKNLMRSWKWKYGIIKNMFDSGDVGFDNDNAGKESFKFKFEKAFDYNITTNSGK